MYGRTNASSGRGTQEYSMFRENDITFYDYDGSIVASYGMYDLPLQSLPQAPDHSNDIVPLVMQQWTMSLSEVNSAQLKTDAGAVYITEDNCTHFIIRVPEGSCEFSFYFVRSGDRNTPVSIHWGDGSSDVYAYPDIECTDDPYEAEAYHMYTKPGVKDIKMVVPDGITVALGQPYDSMSYYNSMIERVHLGSNVTLLEGCFQNMGALQCVTIPVGVTAIGTSTFFDCRSLSRIAIAGVHDIGDYAFERCTSLAGFHSSSDLVSIGTGAFSGCAALRRVQITSSGSSSISIGSSAFSGCTAIRDAVVQGNATFGQSAFQGANSLLSVNINDCDSVPDDMFRECQYLTCATFHNISSAIGDSAFCETYLRVLDLSENTTIPTCGSDAFVDSIHQSLSVYGLIVIVPDNLFDAWVETESWASVQSIMSKTNYESFLIARESGRVK